MSSENFANVAALSILCQGFAYARQKQIKKPNVLGKRWWQKSFGKNPLLGRLRLEFGEELPNELVALISWFESERDDPAPERLEGWVEASNAWLKKTLEEHCK